MRCARLLTTTTRDPSTGSSASSSSPVNAKCPRWFVPNCSSNPSCVVRRGVYITPALSISRSMRGCLPRNASDASRTDASDDRSSRWTETSPPIRDAAAAPFSTSRTASTTVAPRCARTFAVS